MYNAPVDPTPESRFSRFPVPDSRRRTLGASGKWQVPSQLLKIARL